MYKRASFCKRIDYRRKGLVPWRFRWASLRSGEPYPARHRVVGLRLCPARTARRLHRSGHLRRLDTPRGQHSVGVLVLHRVADHNVSERRSQLVKQWFLTSGARSVFEMAQGSIKLFYLRAGIGYF